MKFRRDELGCFFLSIPVVVVSGQKARKKEALKEELRIIAELDSEE